MASATHTMDQLRVGVTAQAGSRFTAILERMPIKVAELEDVNFHFNSAVLLPVPPHQETVHPGQERVTGLSVIALALTHAKSAPAAELLVAGHTDSVGSIGANRTLSERRAANVLAYLQGDAAAWAAACEQHQVEDYQLILKWIADEHGFDCDPGTIDNQMGPMTRGALDRFRAQYNALREGSLAATGPITAKDWEAFFDLYDAALAEIMDVEQDALAQERAALKLMQPPSLGCGEDFPIDRAGHDNVRSEINRRVELLFIEDPAHPRFETEQPPGGSIYGRPARYVLEYLEVEGLSRFQFSV
jgi:outer membrane protein OmpA-like peptidoglycan-associated protein